MHPVTTLRTRTLEHLGLTASDQFTCTTVTRRGNTVILSYDLDGVGPLQETLTFTGVDLQPEDPEVERALQAALHVLHVLAGVSYVKATLPPVFEARALHPELRALVGAVLTDGLAELAWSNGVDLTGHFSVRARQHHAADDTPASINPANGPLVPVGGGKDSIVTLDALRHLEPTLFAVNPRGPILRTFDHAGMPRVTVTRELDPLLFELNDRGAINGHIPITAIVSAVALVAAIAGGHDAVVLSNEGSADEPTLVTDNGRAVNHQWSKSSAFETMFAEVVRQTVVADVDYLSLLRPASELWIAQRFAHLSEWDEVFNSCNRAFHLRGQRREWCGTCPKCRFVFLALAPFTGRDRIVRIVGSNPLNDGTQRDDVAALVGLTDHKPFECVGSEDESAAALARLAADPAWAHDTVVKDLAPLLPVGPHAIDGFTSPPATSALPARFAAALDAAAQP